MQELYADVIIDISHEAIDRTFQYAIPDDIAGRIQITTTILITAPLARSVTIDLIISIWE